MKKIYKKNMQIYKKKEIVIISLYSTIYVVIYKVKIF